MARLHFKRPKRKLAAAGRLCVPVAQAIADRYAWKATFGGRVATTPTSPIGSNLAASWWTR